MYSKTRRKSCCKVSGSRQTGRVKCGFFFFFSCNCDATWKLISQTMAAKDVSELRVWNALSLFTQVTQSQDSSAAKHTPEVRAHFEHFGVSYGWRRNPDVHGWILRHRIQIGPVTGVGQRPEGRRRIVGGGRLQRKRATHNSPPERPCCWWWRKVLRAAAVSLVTESGEIMKSKGWEETLGPSRGYSRGFGRGE